MRCAWVFDAKDHYPSQWAAIDSIAGKIGCTAETLRKWVRKGERGRGVFLANSLGILGCELLCADWALNQG